MAVAMWAGKAAAVVMAAATLAACQNSSQSTSSGSAPGQSAPSLSQSDRSSAHLAACPLGAGTAHASERGPREHGSERGPLEHGSERGPLEHWSERSPLRSITLGCMADGTPVHLEAALAGKPALLNLWAYWCAPCARELPAVAAFAARAGSAVTVLAVHSDPGERAGLARLADLGVRLPSVEDGRSRVRVAVSAPDVLPISVLVRADGTIAKIVVRPFTGVDDIAAVVAENLGVAV